MKRFPIIRPYPAKLFKEIEKRGGTICGGFAKYLCSPNKQDAYRANLSAVLNNCWVNPQPGDVDIYPRDGRHYDRIHEYLRLAAQEGGSSKYNNLLAQNYRYFVDDLKLQLIDYNGIGSVVIKSFDFTVCQAYKEPFKDFIITTDEFHQDEKNLRLRLNEDYTKLQYNRIQKYVDKGYTVSAEDAIKLVINLKEDGAERNSGIITLFSHMKTKKEFNKLKNFAILAKLHFPYQTWEYMIKCHNEPPF